MKTFAFSAGLAACLVFTSTNAPAQITARRIARKAVEANANENRALEKSLNPSPAPTAPPAPAAPASATTPARPLTNTIPEKTAEQKAKILQRTIEFQKKRAEAGAPTAQYDLGMRYLNGDGLEKNPELAQKWLAAAAKNGNTQAAKKIEELKKQ